MFRQQIRLSLFAVLAAFTLALTGCGGGGGGNGDDGMMPEPPDPQMVCEDAGGRYNADGTCTSAAQLAEEKALMDAQGAAMTAADAADTAADAAENAANAQTANKAYDEASYALAQNAAERARAASNAAAAANTAAQAATTSAVAEAQRDIAQSNQRTAETERANAMKYAGMVASAKKDADDAAAADAARQAGNKVAATKKAAITAEATATAARPFDLATAPADLTAPTDAENYVVNVKHTGSAVEVTVLDGALDAENDPKYEQAATFGNGQMLVRNIGTDRKIIVLHTDIEAPQNLPFGNASGYNLTVDIDTDTTANDTYVVQATDARKLGGSAIVPANKGGAQTLAQYAAATPTTPAQNVYRGSLDGASGTFRCDGGTCVISKADDTDGTLSFTGTLWFTPDAGATVEVQDADYLTYGFWLDTTTKDGAIASYDTVQTFATSSLDATTGTLDEVTGTATYEGGAAGVYVHETKNDDGSLDTATSGRFTADVNLQADFDGLSPARTANSIQGTISNFALEDGTANSWTVNVAATINSTFGLADGVASGMTGDNGSISGQFHGTAADRDGDGAGTALAAPPVLVGEFNANFVNGTAAGAFGARRK